MNRQSETRTTNVNPAPQPHILTSLHTLTLNVTASAGNPYSGISTPLTLPALKTLNLRVSSHREAIDDNLMALKERSSLDLDHFEAQDAWTDVAELVDFIRDMPSLSTMSLKQSDQQNILPLIESLTHRDGGPSSLAPKLTESRLSCENNVAPDEERIAPWETLLDMVNSRCPETVPRDTARTYLRTVYLGGLGSAKWEEDDASKTLSPTETWWRNGLEVGVH